MKKIITLIVVSILSVAVLAAQPGYGRGGYPGGPFGHGPDYGRGYERHGHHNNLYAGIKAGLTASHISSGTGEIDASGIKTGTSFGLAALAITLVGMLMPRNCRSCSRSTSFLAARHSSSRTPVHI